MSISTITEETGTGIFPCRLLFCLTLLLADLPAFRFLSDLYKLLVFSVLTDQFLMRTALRDPPVIHNQDLICLLDRGKPVCDRNDRLSSCQLRHRILDQMLVFRIDTCRASRG